MNSLLAKAETIRDGGSTSSDLRRGRNLLHNSIQKRGLSIHERNNHANTKVNEEAGGGWAP